MKNKNQETCPACGEPYNKTSARCKSEHHIYPKRHFAGQGPKADICRGCHNILEKIISKTENKKVLPKEQYENIYRTFILNATSQRLAEG